MKIDEIKLITYDIPDMTNPFEAAMSLKKYLVSKGFEKRDPTRKLKVDCKKTFKDGSTLRVYFNEYLKQPKMIVFKGNSVSPAEVSIVMPSKYKKSTTFQAAIRKAIDKAEEKTNKPLQIAMQFN